MFPLENKTRYQFSHNSILALKGIGIILIFLHNYFHWYGGMGIENEFEFKPDNIIKYTDNVFNSFVSFIEYNFAFWGHFGVQIFIFASGYGLYKSMINKKQNILKFYINKLSKLYILLCLGIISVAVLRYLNNATPFDYKSFIYVFIEKATSIGNFNKTNIFNFSGPYWYFGLTVQFYLCFPLLFFVIEHLNQLSTKIVIIFFILLNFSLQIIWNPASFYINGIILGHLPEFLLGMYLAKFGLPLKLMDNVLWAILSIIVLIVSQYSFYLFPISHIAATSLILSTFSIIKYFNCLKSKQLLTRFLIFTGKISMCIFILNGALREMSIFRNNANKLEFSYIFLFIPILFILSFVVSIILKILNAATDKVLKKLNLI